MVWLKTTLSFKILTKKTPINIPKIVIGFTYIPKTETLNTKEKEKAANEGVQRKERRKPLEKGQYRKKVEKKRNKV